MSFFTLPPEINSLRMFIGAGTAPMLQAAAAWEGLAEELGAAANSFASVTAGLAGQAWQGAAAAAMAAAAAPYAGWLAAAAAQSAGAAGQARTVASIFEAAQAATIHPGAIEANRNAFVQLVMTNLFGQNAGLIAAAESMYEEMWAADVAAMAGYYSGASAVAQQMMPWAGVLKGLPGLGAGVAGGGVGGGNTGIAGVGTGNAGAGSAGSGSAGVGDGSSGSGGVGTANVSGGYVAGNVGSAAGTYGVDGASIGDPTVGTANATSTTSPTMGAATGSYAGSVNPGVGFVSAAMIAGSAMMAGSNSASAGLISDKPAVAGDPKPGTENAGPAAPAPEAPAAETPEAETSLPQIGVLPTAMPDAAAKAAPSSVTRATQATVSGIPESTLRAATPQDAEAPENSTEAAETVAPLRPEAAKGELRPRVTEDAPRLQVRGG
ncbi:PPE family protein [Mycobacterium riyadhense]|uniref:PPE family protein n=1 Tax=Mycobacterium riyadhense TaxID=486698 RepID=UPI00195689E6|nr:PPE family protein [Mycobacterium riyadhense]